MPQPTGHRYTQEEKRKHCAVAEKLGIREASRRLDISTASFHRWFIEFKIKTAPTGAPIVHGRFSKFRKRRPKGHKEVPQWLLARKLP